MNHVEAFWNKMCAMQPNTASWHELPPDLQQIAIQGINTLLFALQSAQKVTNDTGTTSNV